MDFDSCSQNLVVPAYPTCMAGKRTLPRWSTKIMQVHDARFWERGAVEPVCFCVCVKDPTPFNSLPGLLLTPISVSKAKVT